VAGKYGRDTSEETSYLLPNRGYLIEVEPLMRRS
jgi:hypothetical protein